MTERIYLYDSTLRDGAQTSGVDFTSADKQSIALKLDEFGIDYIEGGWPGANPTDDQFFIKPPRLLQAKLTAFGMTRRHNTSAENDPGLAMLANSGVKYVCIVGKSWDFHVHKALGITLEENLAMVRESISYMVKKGFEVLFDAEHFFDGYKNNAAYAFSVIQTAYEAGARWVVLCDTNGGTLPHEIHKIIQVITKDISGKYLGIHCHNDTGNAIANSIEAVRCGVRHIQGTLNGLGERCGNTNLISLIPSLMLKMGFKTGVSVENLQHLTKLSHFLDDRLNRIPDRYAPYVGEGAFSHKGGLHVSAVVKNPSSYEHINPDLVGNKRTILISDQAGKANIIQRIKEIGLAPDTFTDSDIHRLVEEIKERENRGYAYDSADASFEILARKSVGQSKEYFALKSFRVIDECHWQKTEKMTNQSEATIRLYIQAKSIITTAQGNGPVNALDLAMRKALVEIYPNIHNIRLVDYKVRIVNSSAGTEAMTRVLIESEDEKYNRWITIGVSTNILSASYYALRDSMTYKLLKDGV